MKIQREVNSVMNGKKQKCVLKRNKIEELMRRKAIMKINWWEYFDDLLNLGDDMETEPICYGVKRL